MMRRWNLQGASDEALISAYAKGQDRAFERLYLRHRASVFHFLRRQLNNHAIAEELAHDTWIGVIKQAQSYQSKAKFRTWVFRIAHNRLVDHWRKQGSIVPAVLDELSEHFANHDDPSTQGLELQELLQSLEILSADQMAALLLKIEGFSHAEIAEITHSKRETVKSRLRYATKQLRLAAEVS